MALRFLQIFVPGRAGSRIDELLEGHEVLGTWRDATTDDRMVIHLLVDAEEVEPIMDRFEHAYAKSDGFRVVLFPVEAVLPRPETAVADGETDDADEEAGARRSSGRVSREELYGDVSEALGPDRVFVAMTILSSVVASVGLLRDDVAVIIGAMVIAPLLGPNVAMSLASTLGDLVLLRRALRTNVVGVGLALGVSMLLGLVLTIDPTVPALAARTGFDLGDLALALAAGSAGTFAYTRGLSGAVIGVMVAVALMPPLVTFGMLLASGHARLALGALLLVGANVVCINLAGVATFLAQDVRPRTWWEGERAKRSSRTAIIIWCVLLLALGAVLFVSRPVV